jgi:preprotein translocase subunit SecY
MGLMLLIAGFVIVVAGSVLMTVAQRRIPVQQAKHTRGRQVFGGQRSVTCPSHQPRRRDAHHLRLLPHDLPLVWSSAPSPTVPAPPAPPAGMWANDQLAGNQLPDQGAYLYVMLYVAMVYFFSYFWITVQFNPEDMSKQLK